MNHGIYISEIETGIIAPSESYAGLPVIVGSSYKGPVDEPVLVHTYAEAVEIFGFNADWSDDMGANTISEFIYTYFVLYGQSPAVIIRAASATPSGIIGGYDAQTGKTAGLELVNHVYHKFGIVPGIILCPGYSHNPEVAAVMRAKADSVSGLFKCICLTDINFAKYTDVSAWKSQHNYSDKRQIVCWPKVKLGGKKFHLSTHLCGVMNRTDNAHSDVPYKSPSNESLQIDSCVNESGDEVMLTHDEANYLNDQGIITALNRQGWVTWGNRTSIYPRLTDVKDSVISVRRMFDYIGNTFINTMWQKTDQPMTVRLIRETVNSFNLYLNGLTAREMILGGRIEFREDENPRTSIAAGKLTFHLYITPPMPAESIEGILEYDAENLDILYDAVRG